ncbi:peroxiredoxin [Pseudomonas saliphila]|uniref:peroxiredoxin n=1 Tax=Pseudomonas saliphila TaxID=2586906 RepID=UPI00123BDDDB|nr:peroxiredoxin [Pseudomonas saliphila]
MNTSVKALLLGTCLSLAAATASALEVGDMAPDFELPGADGETYRLADYRGEQAVVLAWFPRAFTSGCTIECKSLAENGHLIREYDVTYFMASVDPLAKNKEFAAETGADFPLLSDEDKSVAKAYDVLHMLGYAKRHTFYIDQDGRILKIDTDVEPATSAEDMAATLGELGVARRDSKTTASAP